ncbi:aspartyl-phosphate phosphatase Spo0E family protein [Radiobacillus kanasensis]|uniref:aspartyl-phosphate phosphatase Spo0E family protein n=1 Tax=Radiobacillus kanasensis TaxID=2844358 RepID=UPI001E533CA5|nr:aspartyl-phosphate phosphatase Spo0E family protein [Radiobacillus kanasensis]UFU00862.1 aspartyl-phosphate phosphatase Spo0E family protein [Radiobacillus kanasensis]
MKDLGVVLGDTDLQAKIVRKRKRMFQIAEKYGMNSVPTIKISQELDVLINQYQRIKYPS